MLKNIWRDIGGKSLQASLVVLKCDHYFESFFYLEKLLRRFSKEISSSNLGGADGS